jgi:DNA-binding NtrC family response regulator
VTEPAASTVLVVDDEPTLLQLMTRILLRVGYSVLTADDGDQALEVFDKSEQPVGAVLLDLRVRPRGGLAILNALLSRSPALGVVVTSGSALDPDTRERLHSHGGEFVRKPFAPESLLRAVATVLERSSD